MPLLKQPTNKELCGEIGEKLVAKLLDAIRSLDKYDSEKDMIVRATGKRVEVKTQVRYVQGGMFTINLKHQTNFNKCMTVDHLIFVEIPFTGNIIRIWECTNRKAGTRYRTNDGRVMWGWFINEMTLLYEIDDPETANDLRKHSSCDIL